MLSLRSHTLAIIPVSYYNNPCGGKLCKPSRALHNYSKLQW